MLFDFRASQVLNPMAQFIGKENYHGSIMQDSLGSIRKPVLSSSEYTRNHLETSFQRFQERVHLYVQDLMQNTAVLPYLIVESHPREFLRLPCSCLEGEKLRHISYTNINIIQSCLYFPISRAQMTANTWPIRYSSFVAIILMYLHVSENVSTGFVFDTLLRFRISGQ